MTTDKTGGPAFPVSIDIGTEVHYSKGMTLRDYFASKAMQAHIVGRGDFADGNKKIIAECSYDMADAMLKAREL